MKRLCCVALALGVAAALAVAADPPIKEIMTKGHMGGDSLLGGIEKQVKADSPDWDAVTKNADQLVEFGKVLAKSDPPKDAKGTKEAWQKQTQIYVDNVTALDDAAKKKDKSATAASAMKLRNSCGGCHIDFKPKKP